MNSPAARVRLEPSSVAASALRSGLAEALDRAVDDLRRDPNARAGLLSLGTDPASPSDHPLLAPETRSRAEAACRAERASLHRLASSAKPFIAILRGTIGGTALEVALACRTRLAIRGTGLSFALSDVEVGLAPRLGGLSAIARLGGIDLAVDLAARGRRLGAEEALALGLVDELVTEADVERRADELVAGRPADGVRRERSVGRPAQLGRARHEIRSRHAQNYPAQERALDIIEALSQARADVASDLEVAAFGELALSSTAKNLSELRASALLLERRRGEAPAGALRASFAALGFGYADHAADAAAPHRRFVARIFAPLEAEARHLASAGATQRDVREALRAWGFLAHGPSTDGPWTMGRSVPPEVIQMRCALPLVLEALRALEAGVVPSARHGDVAAVFLGGFPPFRGGPFRYVDEVGPREILARAEVLAREHGSRFDPPPLLRSLAESGRRLHPAPESC